MAELGRYPSSCLYGSQAVDRFHVLARAKQHVPAAVSRSQRLTPLSELRNLLKALQ